MIVGGMLVTLIRVSKHEHCMLPVRNKSTQTLLQKTTSLLIRTLNLDHLVQQC